MKKPLDSRRGAKRRVAYESVRLSADHYEGVFRTPGLWKQLSPLLRKAKKEADVAKAFDTASVPDRHYFVPSLTGLVLSVIRDSRFPKTEDAQIRFFAEALAARGKVSPRRSIAIAQQERARKKSAHRIIRCELYVVCSCGYEGPSLHGKCAQCGAPITSLPF